MQKAVVKCALLITVLNLVAASVPFPYNKEASSEMVENFKPGEDYKEEIPIQTPYGRAQPPPLKLPESQRILASEVHKLLFRPGTGERQLPDVLRSILLPSPEPPVPHQPDTYKPVEVLCHLDRIYVRILKSLFTDRDAWKYLRVGNCVVNEATDQHFYILYYLNSCNVTRQEDENGVTYTNTLYYEPVSTDMTREEPFTVSLDCYYNKHFRSFHVGFIPEVESETVIWGLNTGASLQRVDESWMPFTAWKKQVIDQVIFFEAKVPRVPADTRLYLNDCYINPSLDPALTPKHTVLDNYGCLVDGKKSSPTKFHTSEDPTTLRFSVGALEFKEMASLPKTVVFIHCEIFLGPKNPTPSVKSCSYDQETQRWSELYGDDSVCACCDASCPAPKPSAQSQTQKIDALMDYRVKGVLADKGVTAVQIVKAVTGIDRVQEVFRNALCRVHSFFSCVFSKCLKC